MKRSSAYILIVAMLVAGVLHYSRHQFRRDFSLVLSSNLDRSHAVLQRKDGSVKEAVYVSKGQRLEYPGEPRWFNVEKKADTFEGRYDARIILHPLAGGSHRISFPVPRDASRVRFIWGFSDYVQRNPRGGAVQIRVAFGEQPLLTTDCISRAGCLGLQSSDLLMPAVERGASSSLTIEVQALSNNVDFHSLYFDGYVW
jgi:hypothetical protein